MLENISDYVKIILSFTICFPLFIYVIERLIYFILLNFGINFDEILDKVLSKIWLSLIPFLYITCILLILYFGKDINVRNYVFKMRGFVVYGIFGFHIFYVVYFISGAILDANIIPRHKVALIGTIDDDKEYKFKFSKGYPAFLLSIIIFVIFFYCIFYYDGYEKKQDEEARKECYSFIKNPYKEIEIEYDGYEYMKNYGHFCPSTDSVYIEKYYCESKIYDFKDYNDCFETVKWKLDSGCETFEQQKINRNICFQDYCKEKYKDKFEREDCFNKFFY